MKNDQESRMDTTGNPTDSRTAKTDDATSVAVLLGEASRLLDAIGHTVTWQPDYDPRPDGADQVLEFDRTVCFIATGMDEDLHTARTDFIAAAPMLVRRLHDALAEELQATRYTYKAGYEHGRLDALALLARATKKTLTKESVESLVAALSVGLPSAREAGSMNAGRLDPERKTGSTHGWRDIATAPKDGTPVLTHHAAIVVPAVMVWLDGPALPMPGWYSFERRQRILPIQPTHWMKLPQPPDPPKD